jgi:hypothetical protein
MMTSRIFVAMALIAMASGCGESRTMEKGDQGEDASAMTQPDDAGSMSTTDDSGRPDDAGGGDGEKNDAATGTPDAGTSSDASTSEGRDAGTVAGGSDPRADKIGCGMSTSCTSPQVCCVSLSGLSCTEESGCTGSFSATGHCDGPEDCDSGNKCCLHFEMFSSEPNGAFCRSGDCPMGDNELCHTESDCDEGTPCVECKPPTGGTLDVTYGICSPDGTCPSPFTAP